MAANNFRLNGDKLGSQDDLMSLLEGKAPISDKIYYPELLVGSRENNSISGHSFTRVSFKDTKIHRLKFKDCTFTECLFLDTVFDTCEFSNCSFKDCNFHGSRFDTVRIDPDSLKSNFSFVEDANIAAHTFQALYACMKQNHQPEYSRSAKYWYLHALQGLNHYYHKQGRIGPVRFWTRRIAGFLHRWVSGYGQVKSRILTALLVYIALCALVNVILGLEYRASGNDEPMQLTLTDSIYYTFITITTIGFGDIAPAYAGAKILTILESAIGIFLIALGLNVFAGNGSE